MDMLLNPTWKCISIVLKIIVEYPNLDYSRSSRDEIQEAMHDVYLGDPVKVLVDLERAMMKCRDHDLTRESRDTLKQYLVPIFKFAGKAAVDSAESRGIPVARLLRLSETLMRVEDSPSNFINIGRSLRRELSSVLASAPERSDVYYGGNHSLLTLDQLIRLFSDLTAPSKPPTISSNEDDLDLVSFFTPILQQLQAKTRDPGGRRVVEREVSEVNQLHRLFRDFKAAVENVSRKIKRRDRDPELGKWCYWRDENPKLMGY